MGKNFCVMKEVHMWYGDFGFHCNVSCILTARQRLAKYIPAETNARNNSISIARQQRGKHSSSTTLAVFSVLFVPMGYERTQSEDATRTTPVEAG
jgi:hypothetical protein